MKKINKINKSEYKIISKCFLDSLDFDALYNFSGYETRRKYDKTDIIDSIKKLILEYPHFDTSYDRLESFTLLFGIRFGILNNFIYIAPVRLVTKSWFMKDDVLKSYISYFDRSGIYYKRLNINNILRKHKLNKIWNN